VTGAGLPALPNEPLSLEVPKLEDDAPPPKRFVETGLSPDNAEETMAGAAFTAEGLPKDKMPAGGGGVGCCFAAATAAGATVTLDGEANNEAAAVVLGERTEDVVVAATLANNDLAEVDGEKEEDAVVFATALAAARGIVEAPGGAKEKPVLALAANDDG
jgi:hypothetical protein